MRLASLHRLLNALGDGEEALAAGVDGQSRAPAL